MTPGLSSADLEVIDQRAEAASAVADLPWVSLLETRHGIGGCSFIRCGTAERDVEMYVDLTYGETRISSPDPRLDAVLDFIAAASEDVPRLVAEIRRLRERLADR